MIFENAIKITSVNVKVIRPSGTEPKIKIYISVLASTKENAIIVEKNLIENVCNILELE